MHSSICDSMLIFMYFIHMLQTIPRSAKSRQRSRPTSSSTLLEDNQSRAGQDSDLSETEDGKPKHSEILDFGADIFGDQGWDTDLEIEGMHDTI